MSFQVPPIYQNNDLKTRKNEKYGSFDLISLIYRSNLSYWLKNDTVCRVLSLRYDFEAVSILLYDGQKDMLVNRGSYVNEAFFTYLGNTKKELARKKHMLQYISFYDFLYYCYVRTGIPEKIRRSEAETLISDFLSDKHLFFNFQFDRSILTPDFVKVCHRNSISLATDQRKRENGCYYLCTESFYFKYKRKFTGLEQYNIGLEEESYSGRVFSAVQQGMLKIPDHENPFIFHEDFKDKKGERVHLKRTQNKFVVGLRKECDLQLDRRLKYCSIPIVDNVGGNTRCIGVIRLLVGKDTEAMLRDNEDRKKSIRHAIAVLSFFIHQSYSQEFVDRIVHNWEGEGNAFTPSMNAFCSSMRKAMNAFGCILRLRNSERDMPRIVGKSVDSPFFSRFVEDVLQNQHKDGFIVNNEFNKHLSKCFASLHHKGEMRINKKYRLVGVGISLEEPKNGICSETYYYCYAGGKDSKGNEQVIETSDRFIFKNGRKPSLKTVFHKDALSELANIEIKNDDNTARHLAIRHILIMDIPALDVDGILTFASTDNRPFNLDDARFAYGEMKRFGLENSRVNKERLQANKQLSGAILHDVKNILQIAIDLVSRIDDKPELNKEKLEAKLGTILEFLHIIWKKVENFHQYTSLNLSYETLQKEGYEWNIAQTMTNLCKAMSAVGEIVKGTKVWFNCLLEDDQVMTKVNQNIIELCYFNLLENAVKYSFGEKDKYLIKGYDRNNEKTNGHVHISLSSSLSDHYIIKITSWGQPIQDPIGIFSRSETFDTNSFLESANPPSKQAVDSLDENFQLWRRKGGEGLYSVYKFITAIGGTVDCQSKGGENTFILKFKKHEVRKAKQKAA